MSLARTLIVATPPEVVAESSMATGTVLTTVDLVALLLLELLSMSVPDTVAVSVAGSADASRTARTATVAVPPLTSEPSWQVTVWPDGAAQEPALGVTVPNVAPAGSVSVTVTAGSSYGPAFVTVKV